jgi:hypothetical protein
MGEIMKERWQPSLFLLDLDPCRVNRFGCIMLAQLVSAGCVGKPVPFSVPFWEKVCDTLELLDHVGPFGPK